MVLYDLCPELGLELPEEEGARSGRLPAPPFEPLDSQAKVGFLAGMRLNSRKSRGIRSRIPGYFGRREGAGHFRRLLS